ncbi:MAG: hypothetical protein ACI4SG_01725 [Oligosphaeraceae bacterium]
MEKDVNSKQASSENAMQLEQVKQERKKNSNLRFVCLLIISIAIMVYLVHSLKAIQGRYDSLARNLQNGLEQVAMENRNIHDKFDDLENLIGEGLVEVARENKACIAQSLQVEYEIKSNSSYAREALELAENAWTENETELAKIYLLNAINHMPYEIRYIKAYFQLLEDQNPGLEEWKRFSDILDMAVFQIAPGDVQQTVAIKNAIMQKMDALNVAEQEKSAMAYQEALAQKVASLVDGKLSMKNITKYEGRVDLGLLSTRLETIRSLIDEDILDESEAEKWRTELNKSNIVFQMAVTLASVDNATLKAEAATAKNAPSRMELVTAQNQLQTANALLAQIWAMDCRSAMELLKKAEACQTRIASIDAKIKELWSRPVFEEIKSLVKNIQQEYDQSNRKYTERMKTISDNVESIKAKFAEISDDKMQMEVLAYLKQADAFLQDLSKLRYIAYQKMALELLRECHNKYESYYLFIDNRGDELFDSYLLDINPALLSSDMLSLYNSIYQKVYEKVKDKAQSQIKKCTHVCKSLEDF